MGLLGVLTTPVAGRLIDGLVLWVGILIAVVFLIISEVIMTAAGGINIGAVIVACFSKFLVIALRTASYGFFSSSRSWTPGEYILVPCEN